MPGGSRDIWGPGAPVPGVSPSPVTPRECKLSCFPGVCLNLNSGFSLSAPWPFQIPPTHPRRPLSPQNVSVLGGPVGLSPHKLGASFHLKSFAADHFWKKKIQKVYLIFFFLVVKLQCLRKMFPETYTVLESLYKYICKLLK